MKKIKDIGNLCTHCHKDTSFGSGRFVNRIPSTTDTEEGYMCPSCQSIECDMCDDISLEFEIVNGEVFCGDCFKESEVE